MAADRPAVWQVARFPVILALVLALALGVGIDVATGGPTPPKAKPAPLPADPTAAPAGAISSSWFCAGATDSPAGAVSGTVVIANAGTEPAAATVAIIPSSGAGKTVNATVPANSTITVPETVSEGAPWIGAIVTLDHGDATVEEQVSGTLGASAQPCATTGSTHWYFPSGETLVNATEDISLLNPFPSVAIVDMSFTTEQGLEQPSDFQAMVVAPDSLQVVDVGSHLRRRNNIATTVTVRTGEVVAWQTDVVTQPSPGQPLVGQPVPAGTTVDPAAPIGGVTLSLGAPSARTHWWWAQGADGTGLAETYTVYNPSSVTAQLRLAVNPDQGSAEPISLTVEPGQVTSVVSTAETRIPQGVGHDAVLTSLNGVPVVAQRTLAETTPGGLGSILGSPAGADRWLLGAGSANAKQGENAVVLNTGGTPVRVTLEALENGGLRTLTSFTLAKSARQVLTLTQFGPAFPYSLLVSSTGPVVVERDYYGLVGTRGIGLSLGTPLS